MKLYNTFLRDEMDVMYAYVHDMNKQSANTHNTNQYFFTQVDTITKNFTVLEHCESWQVDETKFYQNQCGTFFSIQKIQPNKFRVIEYHQRKGIYTMFMYESSFIKVSAILRQPETKEVNGHDEKLNLCYKTFNEFTEQDHTETMNETQRKRMRKAHKNADKKLNL